MATWQALLWREARRQPAVALWLIAGCSLMGALLFLALQGPPAPHLLHGPAVVPGTAPAIVVTPAPAPSTGR